MSFLSWTALWPLIVAYAIVQVVKFRARLKSINNFPGQRLLFSATNIMANLIFPAIPYITAGKNAYFAFKHEPFRHAGWDVCSSMALTSGVAIMLADVGAIKEVTSARSRFPKPIEYYKPLNIFGGNIVGSEGDQWKKYRKIAAPAFSERNNCLVWDETVHLLNELFIDIWEDRSSIAVKDWNLDLSGPLTLFIISAAGFGKRLSWKGESKPPPGFELTFHETLQTVDHDVLWMVILPKWLLRSIPRFKKAYKAMDELPRYMRQMIRDRQSKDLVKHDLFSSLLEANDGEEKENSLSEEELMGNIFIFLLAGHETTANTLTFAFTLLALHPEIQEELYQHIKSVFPHDRDPEYHEMALFLYSLGVFYETSRLFPSVSGLPKEAAEDTTIVATNASGEQTIVTVPKGSEVLIAVAGTNYNPRYWDDPEQFKPSRFMVKNWPRDSFLSFSAGPRACLGRKFAETESVAIITKIVSKYRITVTEEPRFAHETPQQRRKRLLAAYTRLTMTPGQIPLTLTRR